MDLRRRSELAHFSMKRRSSGGLVWNVDIGHKNECRRLIEVLESKEKAEEARTLDGDERITLAFEQQVQSFFG
jgi:hypothetical protein